MTTAKDFESHLAEGLAKFGETGPVMSAPPPRAAPPLATDRLGTYVENAVQAECDTIVHAPHGDQNNRINKAAFNVGQLVAVGAVEETAARERLLAAGRAGNHPEGRTVQAVTSGLTDGMRKPRSPWPPTLSAPQGHSRADYEALIASDVMASGAEQEPPDAYEFFGEESTSHQRVPVPRTWQAQSIDDVLEGTYERPRPAVGRRDDGIGLFYPGRMNTVISETEGGKTWLALTVALQEMNKGNHVLYIDFEDDRGGVVGRLLVLGGNADVIRARFHYVRPENRPTPADLVDLAQLLELKPTLAVVDGVTEAMSLYGQDILDNKGTASFGRELLRPLKTSGAAVVTLDHVVKDRDKQGRNPIGAVHKINGLDGVLYMLENVQPLGIGLVGRSRVRIGKDRPGQIRRHGLPNKNGTFWLMDMVVTSRDEDFAEVNLYPPIQDAEPDQVAAKKEQADREEAEIKERQGKILAALSRASEPLTGNGIADRVGGRASTTRRALVRLVDGGQVVAERGSGRSVLHRLPSSTGAES
ncbi:AAA family ATPase [Streptomyces sp. NPDC005251]|uniref:AAA family ATPase n=1 Tax=Streptomyces sp. NPDC005251 TaxID=3157166 RepID=UPI0033BBB295